MWEWIKIRRNNSGMTMTRSLFPKGNSYFNKILVKLWKYAPYDSETNVEENILPLI